MVILIAKVSFAQSNQTFTPVDYASPLMGTASTLELSNGNTYPSIGLPFGMNTWAPQTGKMGDGFLYTYTSNYLYGFRQTHQASLWINDYGQFSIMPVTKQDQFTEEGRKAWFSHKLEKATPYSYSVYLADHHVNAEMAVTERAACFEFTYHPADNNYIVIDAFDKGSYIKIIPDERKIVGYSTRNSGGVPDNFRNYFVISFDKAFTSSKLWEKDNLVQGKSELKSDHTGAVIGFKLGKDEKLQVKVASSFISEEQAWLNLKEIGADDFNTVKEKGKQAWNKELGRVKISGASEKQFRTFYSCLYRMLIFPRKFYEIDKAGTVVHYSPYNGKVLPGYMFTDNGFWDTFRAAFPYFTLMYPTLDAQILQGMENAYRESGWLPEWSAPGHRDCMIGSHSASIIGDAYLKGIRGFDIDLLYEAIIKNTTAVGPVSSVGRLGADQYNSLGYVPFDKGVNQNLSRTLEYAYDDYVIYELAKALKRPEKEQELFASRSLNYRNVFDPQTRLMRPRHSDGSFLTPFDPFYWGDHLTEANSWQYTWSVFHDTKGLANLLGGQQPFLDKLDSLFSLPPVYDISFYKRGVIHLVREMQGVGMGQYAHGNEPMHHVAYLYNFGQPWKTQYWVREIMDKLYTPEPDGYCGDEDNGQMSAWYVFSALGFYPLCPGTDQYVLGAPLFKKVALTLENGKQVIITAPANDNDRRYVKTVKMNNQLWNKNWISHRTLTNGANLFFEMQSAPDKKRGAEPSGFPFSLSDDISNLK